MQYFGVPKCPYCKKRVNLIRTWSLKRQGEYQCPRCGGISNIFLSPLIYVFALLAVFAGGAVYFFHKFVLDDITLSTVSQVLIPFAAFFLLSLFLVYLAKPVIKKVPKDQTRKSRRDREGLEESREVRASAPMRSSEMFYDDQEYLPQTEYRTGPLPQFEDDRDMKILPPEPRKAPREELQRTKTIPDVEKAVPSQGRVPSAQQAQIPAVRTQAKVPAAQPKAAAPARQAQAPKREEAVRKAPAVETVSPVRRSETVRAETTARRVSAPAETARRVQPKSAPAAVKNEDFFARYDDPEYVERRLKEIQGGRGERA